MNKVLRSFYFHYNKPASQQRNKPTISVHYKNKCHLVDNIECAVATEGKINKRQPKFIMRGKAQDIQIKNGIAIIK